MSICIFKNSDKEFLMYWGDPIPREYTFTPVEYVCNFVNKMNVGKLSHKSHPFTIILNEEQKEIALKNGAIEVDSDNFKKYKQRHEEIIERMKEWFTDDIYNRIKNMTDQECNKILEDRSSCVEKII